MFSIPNMLHIIICQNCLPHEEFVYFSEQNIIIDTKKFIKTCINGFELIKTLFGEMDRLSTLIKI